MSIVTLTSDMGLSGYYVAAVKAALLKACPNAQLVDVTHNIPPFDTNQAAFVVRNVYRDFPEGSIHIISVDAEARGEVAHVAVECEGQYFISADNGLLSLIVAGKNYNARLIRLDDMVPNSTFPARDVFAPAACFIYNSGFEPIGEPLDELKRTHALAPVEEPNCIRGTVIFIDSYGNAVTNITRELFQRVGNKRMFRIHFGSERFSIRKISNNYSDVPVTEKLAMFNSNGNLQIAINGGAEGAGGGAQSLLGIRINDMLRIDFEDGQNR